MLLPKSWWPVQAEAEDGEQKETLYSPKWRRIRKDFRHCSSKIWEVGDFAEKEEYQPLPFASVDSLWKHVQVTLL